jgi:hypothetical protein
MTFWAAMYPDTQIFRHIDPTFRAKLTAPPIVHSLMVSPSFTTNLSQDTEKLSG